MAPLTLIPLTLRDHTELLQAVYDATPSYWQMFEREAAPELQALYDLRAMEETPGRALLGILHPAGGNGSNQSAEMIGVVDIRMHHPERNVTTIGKIMIAEPWQRKGQGRAAWALVEAWLAGSAGMQKARAGIEQFNNPGLQFFEAVGFTVTGEATRVPVDERLVRLIYAEKSLAPDSKD